MKRKIDGSVSYSVVSLVMSKLLSHWIMAEIKESVPVLAHILVYYNMSRICRKSWQRLSPVAGLVWRTFFFSFQEINILEDIPGSAHILLAYIQHTHESELCGGLSLGTNLLVCRQFCWLFGKGFYHFLLIW